LQLPDTAKAIIRCFFNPKFPAGRRTIAAVAKECNLPLQEVETFIKSSGLFSGDGNYWTLDSGPFIDMCKESPGVFTELSGLQILAVVVVPRHNDENEMALAE